MATHHYLSASLTSPDSYSMFRNLGGMDPILGGFVITGSSAKLWKLHYDWGFSGIVISLSRMARTSPCAGSTWTKGTRELHRYDHNVTLAITHYYLLVFKV